MPDAPTPDAADPAGTATPFPAVPAAPRPWPAEPGPPADPVPGTGGRGAIGRRRFLALAGGAGAAAVLAATLGPRAWEGLFGGSSRAAAGALGSSTGRTLVIVTLYGGNDGLNTVVPTGDPGYAAARGPLALDASTVLPLADGFGLHPSLPGLKKLWDARQLAVVHGVGFADPNYSHFESMDIWQSGVPGTPVSTGWIGRWLDATSSSPLRAVGIGPTTPAALTGERVQGVALPAGPLVLPGGASEQALYEVLAGTSASEALLQAEAARSNAALLEVDRQLGPVLARTQSSDPLHLKGGSGDSAAAGASLAIADGGGGRSGAGILATQLSIVANLVLAGASSEVYSVELGGFDTHADQAPTQKALLGEVDTAVSAFVDAMAADPRGRGTVVVVYTEFGRRVAGNASGGSDHGWANVAFVAGPGVRGGFYGEPPSLTKLSEGNLVFTTDFRSVYATVLDRVLGTDPKPFLQGSFPTLGFV